MEGRKGTIDDTTYWLFASATTLEKSPAAAPLSFHILQGKDEYKNSVSHRYKTKVNFILPKEKLGPKDMNFVERQEKRLE